MKEPRQTHPHLLITLLFFFFNNKRGHYGIYPRLQSNVSSKHQLLSLSLYTNSHSEALKTETLSSHTQSKNRDQASECLQLEEQSCTVFPSLHMTHPNQPKCTYSTLAPSSYKHQHSSKSLIGLSPGLHCFDCAPASELSIISNPCDEAP